MFKLKTRDLQNFIKLSAPILSNSILPIHKYLRLSKDGMLAKTSGRVFVCYQIEGVIEQDILLEEIPFSAFVKFTKAEEITVSIEKVKDSSDTKITLSDGTAKQSFQSPIASLFDKLPAFQEDEAVELDDEALMSIGIASKCVAEIGGGANMDFVHLSDGVIFGTNQQKLYSKKIKGVPDAYFDKDCATIISQFQNMQFCKFEKYNLFKAGSTLYGFQQFGDVKPLNIKWLLDKKLDGEYFEFEAVDLLRYCELVSASIIINGKEVLECELNAGELYCYKEEYGKEVKMSIPFKGEYKAKMKFNPKHLAPYVRALGIPTIRFYDFTDPQRNRFIGFYVGDPEDNNFIGMISAIHEA